MPAIPQQERQEDLPRVVFASSATTYTMEVPAEGMMAPAAAHVALAEIAKDTYGMVICQTMAECQLCPYPPKAQVSCVIDDTVVMWCNEQAHVVALGRTNPESVPGNPGWTRIDITFTSALDFLWFIKVFAEAKSDVIHRARELRDKLRRVMRTVPSHSPPSRPEHLCTVASHRASITAKVVQVSEEDGQDAGQEELPVA
ncbi:uncharacterized protein TRAVEDRAFT_48932 [Trametes versicolor FP-101664 SS1]|uniref:uncharacterized protein n=1 Tax=Trametes versicolor (strain FP-101664) TaxID=717944 RepID=UPI0004623B8E|nr:uncharacterized protein TRAVEDRAFT_48932 [Trametes versicolor FP-101664 SS1]EIW57910.1 hypothetical protein TRAVEDRAFT_48932 [Trametes versicolor FP-101664 SS1]